MKINIKIIGRGKAGWHSEGIGEQSYSSSVSTVSSSGGDLESYAKDAADETPVYDAENADNDAFIDFVYNGPMIRVTAQDEPLKKRYGSFDFVSVNNYLQLLRKVPGVKFGKVISGQVIWE